MADQPVVGRRGLLGAVGGGLLLGSTLGVVGARLVDDPPPAGTAPAPDASPSAPEPVAGGGLGDGVHQSGIAQPSTPQAHGTVFVGDLALLDSPTTPATTLIAFLGELQRLLVAAADSDLIDPDGARQLSFTVGLGPRAVRLISTELPGARDLPDFADDATIDPRHRGGDLLVAVYASDPGVVGRAVRAVAGLAGVRRRWQQSGFRAPGTGTIARNPLGHLDGIVVPRGDAELDANVWIDAGPAAGGTICVIRRLRLDEQRFDALPVAQQESVIGRRRSDGAPLSGGGPTDEVNLTAKTADGQYLVPARSHARAAHPSFTGSALMLRRSYAFDNGDADAGLLFICFQRDLDTFVKTQRRLDDQDDLMAFVTPTASATFLILPGPSAERPLGTSLLEVEPT